MAATVRIGDSTIVSQIDQDILRLKRDLAWDDAKGHSCEQCEDLRIKQFPGPGTNWKDTSKDPIFRLDTTVEKVHDLAASGCNLWAMIRDKLALIDLESKIREERNNVSFDLTKHRTWWSEEHYKDLAASLGGEEEKEFWRLCKAPVFWGFWAGASSEVEFPVTRKEFVRVIIKYSSLNDFKDSDVVVDVSLVVPQRPFQIAHFAHSGSTEMQLTGYWTSFLALAIPGTFAKTTQSCIGAPINLRQGNPTTMTLVRNWLRKCKIHHNCGIGNPPSLMPSMVLEVCDGDTVRLFQVPTAMKERYIALSYCWGTDSQAIMLSEINKRDLVSGIDPQHLDPTIRDAVIVTRELGFRFLWIDALCILQDDDEFKANELAKMGEIYQNATITIVASAARNVREGFLKDRASTIATVGHANGHAQPVFKLQTDQNKDGGGDTNEPIILRPKIIDEIEPWYERAWTLQEMLFSRRRLQYRANQTTWLCLCSDSPAQECDGWLASKGHTYTNHSDEDYKDIMAMLRNGKASPQSANILSFWYKLVGAYSGRKLRYRTDRLPAISGIAREFASISGDQYLCGLWKSDLPPGLLWYPIGAGRQTAHENTRSRPSWSWTSYEGSVTWWEHRLSKWHPNQDFEVLDHSVELASPSEPFGEVKMAELHICGLLRPITIPSRGGLGNISVEVEGRRAAVVFEYPEDPRLQSSSDSKLALLVVVNLECLGVEGIVVLEEEEDRYSRVGWFAMEDIWPVDPRFRWVKKRDRPKKSPKEHRDRVKILWGGEQSVQKLVLI